ncbi:unnamed protein product [Nyctereutes procyonoides]|uniref:(raccoon dog) hypothetical protein n=1 Tax=Nyctereutes procyonoides TaxID=34880 RepID=A0A811YUJ6_NYCPR|nr:unnamed protein product [Nyctereutes procyonoides]
MKSSDIDQDLFTDSYCKVCSAQLISESQRVAHYESRKHASKVRLYYMLHPRDGGCPAKRLRSENGNDADMVDKNKCCTLCNMSFTSAVVADSHYQGKIHAKRLKLLLGEKTPLKTTATPLNSLKPPRVDTAPVVASPYQRRDSDRYCGLCAAWFNNPLMAQQHYDGKKHKKNAARVALLEQLGTTLDMGELRGEPRKYSVFLCPRSGPGLMDVTAGGQQRQDITIPSEVCYHPTTIVSSSNNHTPFVFGQFNILEGFKRFGDQINWR